MDLKNFHLGDVLSVVTPALISPRGTDGVADLLGFMVSKEVHYLYQLPGLKDFCEPYLQQQFPHLVGTDLSMITPKNWQELLADLVAQHGEYVEVKALPPGTYTPINPLTELMFLASNPGGLKH